MVPDTQTFSADLQSLCHYNTKRGNINSQSWYLNGTLSYFPVHKEQQYHAVICHIPEDTESDNSHKQ
jgi:hypothetical protein